MGVRMVMESPPDELKTLTSLGIASIDLISTHDGRQVGGGLIDSTAGFTFTNGTRRDIADIGLAEKTEAAQGAAPINPLHGGSSCCSLTGKAVATYRSCIGMSVLTVTIGCVRVYRIARQSSSAFFMTRRHSDAAP